MKKNDIRYIDKPDEGVTVAIMGDEHHNLVSYDALDIIAKLLRNSKYLDIDDFCKNTNDLMMRPVIKAVSKCHPDYDTYDMETGRLVARQKCLDKYHEAVDKRLIKFLDDLYTLTNATEQYLLQRGTLVLGEEIEYVDDEE